MPSERLRKVYDSRAWRRIREQVLQRDQYRCRWIENGVRCWRSKLNGHVMTVDHVNPYGGEVLTNLITLCRHHHGKKDGGRANRRKW